MKKINWALILILILAGFLRFYKLGQSPAGFYLDEAAIGYNAWSVLETGRDEFGHIFPVLFRSFAVFMTPIYSYTTMLLVKFLGLSVFSTRLLSALSGTMTVFVLYLLVNRVGKSRKLAFWSAILLAISPWHIMFSRTTYETNLALMFLVIGLLFFYKAIERAWFLLLSVLFFVLSFLTYNAERIVAPLFFLILLFSFRTYFLQDFKKYRWYFLTSLFLGVFLILPTIKIALTPGFRSRLDALSIFSSGRISYGKNTDCAGIFCDLSNNNVLLLGREFLSLYVSYFSPRHLFNLGDYGPRSSYVDLSTFYIWQLPLYFLGLYFSIKKKGANSKFRFVAGLFLVLGALPAAMTGDPYSTIRALPMVVGWVMIMAVVLSKIPTRFSWILGGLVLVSVIRWYLSGVVFNDYFRASFWELGIEESVETIVARDDNLPVVVDNSRGEPYIQWLFFLKYDPEKYQQDNFEVSEDEYYTNMKRNPVKNLGKITVRPIVWGKDTDDIEQYLVAGELALSMDQIRDHRMDLIKEILYPDGSVAYRIAKTNPKGD